MSQSHPSFCFNQAPLKRFPLLCLLIASLCSSCQLFGGGGRGAVRAEVIEEAEDSADHVMDALAEGDDELARTILLRMRAFHPDEGTQAWIDNVMLVLDARQLLSTLDLKLAIIQHEVDGAQVKQLVLRARSEQTEPVVLRMTPPALRCRRDWIDGLGNGGRMDDTAALDFLVELEIPAAGEVEIVLFDLDGARGAAAALRERWDLEMHFCSLDRGEQSFTINAPIVSGVERYLLASHLNLGELDTQPLIDALRGVDPPPLPKLVERAVRIPVRNMSAALDDLTPVIEGLSMKRVELASPVLAWIAESSSEAFYSPGDALSVALQRDPTSKLVRDGRLLAPRHLRNDARAWKAWFLTRARLHALKTESTLDLPTAMGHSLRP